MKVLIIGGRRYLGPRLVHALLVRGHEPVLFNRGRSNAPLPVDRPVREIRGDRNRPGDLASVVEEESFDAVVDTQAFGADDTEPVVRTLSGRIGRYLVISSVACYGRLLRVPADETHPYTDDARAFPGGGNDYAVGKRDVEQIVLAAHRESGFPAIIIRPSVSYGYGRLFSVWGYSNRHVDRIRKGRAVIAPDTGEGLIQPVYIDDEAEVIVLALETDGSLGEAFNCAGPVAVPLWQYFRAHADALGLPVEVVEIPAAFLGGFDPMRCTRASENLVFNHAYDVLKLKRVLGFEHRFGLEAGLAATIAFQDQWHLIEPSEADDPDDRLIGAWQTRGNGDPAALGEQARRACGHEPGPIPLTPWAPDHYRPAPHQVRPDGEPRGPRVK